VWGANGARADYELAAALHAALLERADCVLWDWTSGGAAAAEAWQPRRPTAGRATVAREAATRWGDAGTRDHVVALYSAAWTLLCTQTVLWTQRRGERMAAEDAGGGAAAEPPALLDVVPVRPLEQWPAQFPRGRPQARATAQLARPDAAHARALARMVRWAAGAAVPAARAATTPLELYGAVVAWRRATRQRPAALPRNGALYGDWLRALATRHQRGRGGVWRFTLRARTPQR